VPAHLGDAHAPWKEATVELAAPFRGDTAPHTTSARVRVPASDARFAVISDVDDTILHTGAQRMWRMVRTTLTGSALTRTPFAGAPELYRALAGGPTAPDTNPFFYVSSSPWNLHGFLTAFLEHRDFPLGPLLLRDLGIDETKFIKSGHGTHKLARISEVLELHPDLEVVLIGDSGQHDPRIYAEVVRRFPERVRAIYIREVRLDPGDGRVEAITDGWDHDVPFVLAADSSAVAQHAADLGLLEAADVRAVEQAVAASAPAQM
jgi:phosphatidate phosphatase APP1